jgi:hypothetical protein
MKTIPVRFVDLRRAAEQVPAFVEKQLSCEAERGLRTAIEDDMGSAGLDTEELLLDFSKQFKVDISKFDFTGLISPEGGHWLASILLLPLLAIHILAWAMKLLLVLLLWTFNPNQAKALLGTSIEGLINKLLNIAPKPRHQVLTIGDFVASAATGHFVKRERVRFVLS